MAILSPLLADLLLCAMCGRSPREASNVLVLLVVRTSLFGSSGYRWALCEVQDACAKFFRNHGLGCSVNRQPSD